MKCVDSKLGLHSSSSNNKGFKNVIHNSLLWRSEMENNVESKM